MRLRIELNWDEILNTQCHQIVLNSSGANDDITVWRIGKSIDGIPDTLNQFLGQTATPDYSSSGTTVTVYLEFTDPTDVKPVGGGADWWVQLWDDHGSHKKDDYTVWIINKDKIPPGFHCLSPCFFKKDLGRKPPTADEVQGQVLVKDSLVKTVPGVQLTQVWNDHGTHADENVSLYLGPDGFGLFGFPNYDLPAPDVLYPVLDFTQGAPWQQPDTPFLCKRGPAVKQSDDQDSHANRDVTVWRIGPAPVKGIPVTLNSYLGQTATPGYPSSATILYLQFNQSSLIQPVGSGDEWWTQLWNDSGSGRPNDYTIWQITPQRIPPGFTCLSPYFFKKSRTGRRDPPTADEVQGQVLVKDELVTKISGDKLKNVWTDQGTHARADVSLYTGPDGLGIFGFNNYDPPSSTTHWPILNQLKGAELLD
ncbi:hypothetical protein R1sor_003476 [Riccia sorocarpa]|uniref:Uncharacterized protein n=1 Tax=Riccia sorocarpa TaxID=122646 RepID=A0ABD3H4J8_9MARC